MGASDTIVNRLSALLDGDLSLFGGPRVAEPAASRLRAEQVATVMRYTQPLMLANVFNALVLVAMEWGSARQTQVLWWAFALITFALYLYLNRRAHARRSRPWRIGPRVVRKAVVNALVLGCLWAIAPAAFYGTSDSDARTIITCLNIGMLCGAAFGLATLPVAAMCLVFPLASGAIYSYIAGGSVADLVVAVMMVVYSSLLMRSLVKHSVGLASRTLEQIAAEEAGQIDPLTQLPDQLAFGQRLTTALQRADRYGESFAVLLAGIDDLQAIRDRSGPAAVDDLLVQVATRLRSCVRDVDIVARCEGSRFGILATAVESPEQAILIAERIAAVFRSPLVLEGRQQQVSLGIGIALAPDDARIAGDLLRKAGAALDAARPVSGGAHAFFNAQHENIARERRAIEADLLRALANGEFRLEFQPIMNLARGRIAGAEALLRWDHPQRGLIPPARFIPVAEEIGLIQDIGEWVIREAIRAAATWPEDVRVAINISALQFRTAGIVSMIRQALLEQKIAAGRVEVEITESTLLADADDAIGILSTLRDMGVSVALDDFGTGYSSLTWLLRLPIDRIKIDRSFVQNAPTRPDCATLVRAVLGLARDLKLQVTAEGVETTQHLAWLHAQQCDEAQGYLISRPITSDDFVRLLDVAPARTATAA